MKVLLLLVILLLPAGKTPVASQDYLLYGDLELRSFCLRLDDETCFNSALHLRANHLLGYSWGEVVVRHRVTALTGEPVGHDLFQAAFLIWPVERITIQMGRHTLPLGMGQVFFPADALNPERSRIGENRGFDGASIAWTLSPQWTISLASRLDTAYGAREVNDPWRDIRWAGVLSGYAGVMDLSAGTVYQPDELVRPGIGVSLPLGKTILHGEASWELQGSLLPEDEITAPASGELRGGLMQPPVRRGPAAAGGLRRNLNLGTRAVHILTVALEYLYTEQLPDPGAGHYLAPIIAWDGDGLWAADLSGLISITEEIALVRFEISRHLFDSLTVGGEAWVPLYEGWRKHFPRGSLALFGRVHF